MQFIQGNINSNKDLIEAMDAMRKMLTQDGHKAELVLELAEVNNKLEKISGPIAPAMGDDEYTYLGILHALKNNLEARLRKLEDTDDVPQEVGYDDVYNLEARLRKLEDIDNGPQETGYDDFYEDDDLYEEGEEGDGEENNHKLIVQFLKQAYHISDDEIREKRHLNDKKPQDVDNEGSGNEYEGLTAEAFLEEILEKINAKTEAEIHKLQNGNIGW